MPGDSAPTIKQRLATLKHVSSEERCRVVREIAQQPSQADAMFLVTVAQADRSPHVRSDALEGLGRVGGPLARLAARAALGDRSYIVRWRAADVLIELGTADDAFRLLLALNDTHYEVRSSAADALGGIRTPAVRAALLAAAASDPHPIVRRDAAHALAQDNDAGVPTRLTALVENETEPLALVGLRFALLLLGDPAQLGELIGLLACEDYLVRSNVVNGIDWSELDPAEIAQVSEAFREARKTETHPAVRGALESSLRDLAELTPAGTPEGSGAEVSGSG